MANTTIEEMVGIIRYTNDQGRVQSAVKTLLGLIPTYTRQDFDYIVQAMEGIIKYNSDVWRQDQASNVLIFVRNAQR